MGVKRTFLGHFEHLWTRVLPFWPVSVRKPLRVAATCKAQMALQRAYQITQNGSGDLSDEVRPRVVPPPSHRIAARGTGNIQQGPKTSPKCLISEVAPDPLGV